MKLLNQNNFDYLMDEFGRVVIKNKEILEQINGVGELELLTNPSNYQCKGNGLCGNAGCDKLRS